MASKQIKITMTKRIKESTGKVYWNSIKLSVSEIISNVSAVVQFSVTDFNGDSFELMIKDVPQQYQNKMQELKPTRNNDGTFINLFHNTGDNYDFYGTSPINMNRVQDLIHSDNLVLFIGSSPEKDKEGNLTGGLRYYMSALKSFSKKENKTTNSSQPTIA